MKEIDFQLLPPHARFFLEVALKLLPLKLPLYYIYLLAFHTLIFGYLIAACLAIGGTQLKIG